MFGFFNHIDFFQHQKSIEIIPLQTFVIDVHGRLGVVINLNMYDEFLLGYRPKDELRVVFESGSTRLDSLYDRNFYDISFITGMSSFESELVGIYNNLRSRLKTRYLDEYIRNLSLSDAIGKIPR